MEVSVFLQTDVSRYNFAFVKNICFFLTNKRALLKFQLTGID